MNRKIFSVDNLECMPNYLMDMICSKKDAFHSWFKKDNDIDFIKSDRSIIYQSAEVFEIFECLRSYLSTSMIRAYHATRISDPLEIMQDGLFPFEVEHYTKRIARVLSERGISADTCQIVSRGC